MKTFATRPNLTGWLVAIAAVVVGSAAPALAAGPQIDVEALQARVVALEAKLEKVSYSATGLNGKPTLKIDGANLQIVNGSGATKGTLNGLGNLFIGYNEHGTIPQTGAHSLIMGTWNGFTSYGALINGYGNKVTGAFSSVLGGAYNTANGNYSSIAGGYDNTVNGAYSSIHGGNNATINEQFGTD